MTEPVIYTPSKGVIRATLRRGDAAVVLTGIEEQLWRKLAHEPEVAKRSSILKPLLFAGMTKSSQETMMSDVKMRLHDVISAIGLAILTTLQHSDSVMRVIDRPTTPEIKTLANPDD